MMNMYSCWLPSFSGDEFLASNPDAFASPRCSSSLMTQRQEQAMINRLSPLQPLARQESFKRSKSFCADSATPEVLSWSSSSVVMVTPPTISTWNNNNSDDCSNLRVDTLSISGLGTEKKAIDGGFGSRGLKRTAAERTFSISEISGSPQPKKSPVEMQTDIAEKVATYLMVSFQGSVKPKPVFIGAKPAAIPFPKYVERLMVFINKYADEKDGPESIGVRCAALALEYIERSNLNLDEFSIHRVFLAAYLLGIKLIYDFYMSNTYWGEVGGLGIREVNALEIVFCGDLKWEFKVAPEIHEQRFRALISLSSACGA